MTDLELVDQTSDTPPPQLHEFSHPNMNWTGGSLQRTKHANKGVIQKQKAYFAKTRTHLQNGSPSKTVPFRPSYALEDETNLAQYLRTEDLKLLHREPKGRKHLLQDRAIANASDQFQQPRDSATRARPRVRAAFSDDEPATPRSSVRESTDRHKLKRKRDDTHKEFEILEAKRRRLLKTHDWIGVALSQPLLPSFFPGKDRARIGKRRRVRASHGTTLQRQDGTDVAADPSGLLGDRYPGAFIRARNADHLNDLRIHIGTDALTTVASTVPNVPNQSFASSDSMLFDQQSQTKVVDSTRSPKPIASPPDILEEPRAWVDVHARSESQLADEELPREGVARAKAPSERSRLHHSRNETVHARGGGMLLESEGAGHNRLNPQFQIMQYVEGVGQPFRLVFDSSNSFGNNGNHDNSIREVGSGGTNCASDAAHAGDSKMDNMHERSGKAGFQSESEAAGASAIVDVDEALWKSVLDLGERSSSHTRATKPSGTSAVHAHTKARSHEVERCSWSQHATQDGRTRIGSSLISASLPSLKQEAQLSTNVQGAKNVKRRDLRTNTMLDQEEQLWQNFVFGSGEEASSGDGYDRDSGSIQYWKPSSGVPLSVVVSPVSNTPIRARRARRTLDSVHDTAMFAPPPGPRTIASSAATAGFDDKVCDGEGERSASTRRSVTHSSSLNNASGETNFYYSGMSGRTETSRGGLEQTDRSRDSLLAHDAESGPREFLHGNPDPDDWELDLVDPNRL